MLQVECEDKARGRFRLWCTTGNRYVLTDADRDTIRERMREVAQANADTWTDTLVDEALEAGEVPRRGREPSH